MYRSVRIVWRRFLAPVIAELFFAIPMRLMMFMMLAMLMIFTILGFRNIYGKRVRDTCGVYDDRDIYDTLNTQDTQMLAMFTMSTILS